MKKTDDMDKLDCMVSVNFASVQDKDQGYRRKNYVPLSKRKDWDGKVEKLPFQRKK